MTPEESLYVITFERELRRRLRLARTAQLDDVVQHETLRLLERLGQKMGLYPQPEVYAAVRGSGRRAPIDYSRRESSRGALGPRTVAADAHDPADGGPSTWDLLVYSSASGSDSVETADMLRAAMLRLSPDQREVLLLVDGYGYTVNEVAAMKKMARETISRKRTAAYRTLRRLQPPC